MVLPVTYTPEYVTISLYGFASTNIKETELNAKGIQSFWCLVCGQNR